MGRLQDYIAKISYIMHVLNKCICVKDILFVNQGKHDLFVFTMKGLCMFAFFKYGF